MISLVDGSLKYLEEYKEAYLYSLEKVNEKRIKKHDLMFENPDEVDIIQKMKDSRNKEKLKPNRVLSYNYFIVDHDQFIGIINIRMGLTPTLLQFGGNIGYAIHPKYWKQGYGTEALKLGLKKAKALGLNKVLITCDDDNIGSYRIIEKNGGVLENKVENTVDEERVITRRYWIYL